MKKKNKPTSIVRRNKLKFYCLFLLLILAIIGAFLAICFTMPGGSAYAELLRILALITMLLVAAGLLVGGFELMYNRYVVRPVEKLSDAAQKVAKGDFTVRLSPMHEAEKRDEFDALFENFNIMTAELASTEIMKKDFISNVSHEFKTPIAVIQNFSTILMSDCLSEEERRLYAGKISEATARLSLLITNILQLSRLENQKIVANRAQYNLSEQLCRCLIGFEQEWENKQIELETDFDQNIIVCSDESLLDIVWNNLLSNALKFTPAGGRVSVRVSQQEGRAVVCVADTGCGISARDLKHIFDKFYQADSSHAVRGNGLGLALVREILSLLGGSVRAESTLGAGTRFTVQLPLN